MDWTAHYDDETTGSSYCSISYWKALVLAALVRLGLTLGKIAFVYFTVLSFLNENVH